MISEDEIRIFISTLKENHKEFLSIFNEFFTHVAISNKPQITNSAIKLKEKANIIREMKKADPPKWLVDTIANINPYLHSGGSASGGDLRESLLRLSNALKEASNHTWSLQERDYDPLIDFDKIFSLYFEKNKIPELFNQVLILLQEIIDSGEIDSIRIFNSLKKILDTLKENQKNSPFAILLSWEYVKNLISELLKESKIGAFIGAYEKAKKQLDSGIVKAQTEAKKHAKDKILKSPMLPSHAVDEIVQQIEKLLPDNRLVE